MVMSSHIFRILQFNLQQGTHRGIFTDTSTPPTLTVNQWVNFVVFQLLNHVWLFVTLWTIACQAPLSSAISWSLFKLMSIESVMLSNHLILCCPLLLLPSVFPSIKVFSNELVLLIRWPKYWSFSVSPSNKGWLLLGLTGLISLLSKGLSRVFSSTTIQKHQCFGTQPSL